MTTAGIYQSRVTTAQEAVKTIKSGNRVFLTGNVSVPQKILAALVEYAPNLTDVEICQALTVGSADYVGPEMEGHLRVNSMFISANIRKAVQEGRADFTPVLLSEFHLESAAKRLAFGFCRDRLGTYFLAGMAARIRRRPALPAGLAAAVGWFRWSVCWFAEKNLLFQVFLNEVPK